MPLVNAKCTNCGGTLQVDNAKEAAVCPFCGSAFIVEKAIQNYNIVNNIQANVVNVYGAEQKDFVIKSGVLTQYKGESVNVVIPDNVLEIGAKAFANSKYLSSVTLPASLKRIGGNAFSYCESLTQLFLPAGLQSIGDEAFSYCENLEKIQFPAGLRSIGDCAFARCNSLRSVTIPSSVRTIGHCAFSNCNSLTEAVLEEGVQTIGAFAFYGCGSLQKIVLPKSLQTVFPSAFEECPQLRDVWYNGTLTELVDFCANSYKNVSNEMDAFTRRMSEIYVLGSSPVVMEDEEDEFDESFIDYSADLEIPSLKNLYVEGKLFQGTFTFPEESAEKGYDLYHFCLLRGYDKIQTIVLPRNYYFKGRLRFCPVCGGFNSISLFGKCKKCGTKFIREKK